MNTINRDYSNLVGTPYEEMNCWEAARSFYLNCLGVDLKHYCEEAPSDREEIKNLIYTNRGDFEEIKIGRELKFGDLVLFKIRGIESHIGVFVGGGKFFHAYKGTGSCVDRIDRWKHLIAGVYRMKENK